MKSGKNGRDKTDRREGGQTDTQTDRQTHIVGGERDYSNIYKQDIRRSR